VDRSTRDLIDASDGSYSTSDWGCVGDTIGIAPRIYPAPRYLKEYLDWQQALVEASDTCALQNGVCWVVKPSQQAMRYGQENNGGCPGCQGPGPTGMSGLRGLGDASPIAVVSPNGTTLLPTPGFPVPTIWQRNPRIEPPNRIVMAPAGRLYRGAVYAAQYISRKLGKPQVINAVRNGRIIPITYVEPGGVVRTTPLARGWETTARYMDPFEVQQAYAASRGASLLPWGM
jgi:hypothetical protein